MANNELETSILNLLKNINESDRDVMSDSINMNLIHLIQKENIKSVMFIYHALFEPSIDKTIIYCLNHNIDCFFMFNNKRDYTQVFKITTDNHNFEFYKYTIQPIPKKFVDKLSKNTPVDLLITPIMAYDLDLHVLDYNYKTNFVRWVSANEDAKKCAYCFSIQEMHGPLTNNYLEFDYVVNEYDIVSKR